MTTKKELKNVSIVLDILANEERNLEYAAKDPSQVEMHKRNATDLANAADFIKKEVRK